MRHPSSLDSAVENGYLSGQERSYYSYIKIKLSLASSVTAANEE